VRLQFLESCQPRRGISTGRGPAHGSEFRSSSGCRPRFSGFQPCSPSRLVCNPSLPPDPPGALGGRRQDHRGRPCNYLRDRADPLDRGAFRSRDSFTGTGTTVSLGHQDGTVRQFAPGWNRRIPDLFRGRARRSRSFSASLRRNDRRWFASCPCSSLRVIQPAGASRPDSCSCRGPRPRIVGPVVSYLSGRVRDRSLTIALRADPNVSEVLISNRLQPEAGRNHPVASMMKAS